MQRLPNIAMSCCGLAVLLVFATAREASADDNRFTVAGGKISLAIPDGWKQVQPRVRIIEHEFQVDAENGDKENGRVTVMGAGGSIEDNVNRWIGQFDQPDGTDSKERATSEKKTVDGVEVHLLDISGTYKDSPGPFAGARVTMRPDYRMLAAIITTAGDGNYFVKFYGPAKTVAANKEKFDTMIDSLKKK